MHTHKTYPRLHRQSGFSLVEVMIGSIIGLLILMGVVMVYLSGSRTAATTEALSRVQESGRFGMHFLARDIRNAGFKRACQNDVNILLDEANAAYSEDLFNLDDALLGWNDSAGTFAANIADYVRGDVLLIKTASRVSDVSASGKTPANAAVINTNPQKSGIDAGTIMFVGDSESCDIFQKGNNANANGLGRGAGAGGNDPGNKNPGGNNFSKAYDDSMQIFLFDSTIYYIGAGLDGQPALKRVSFSTGTAGTPEELVNGIDDMQLLYGEDTDGDQSVDNYVAAGAVTDWEDVVAIQVNLLASSLAAGVIDEAQALPAPWAGLADPGDGRLRRVFSSTVGIRNRLP